MKAVRVHQYGGLEALTYEELPMPEPGEGQARVKIQAIGVNFIDIYHRIGRYRGSLPLTLGQEAAGTVDAVGPNVTEVKPGDRVAYASVQGSYAEYAVAPAWRLVPIPNGVEAQQAAAVMLQGLTAHYLTLSTFPLKRAIPRWSMPRAAGPDNCWYRSPNNVARALLGQPPLRKKLLGHVKRARTKSSFTHKPILKQRSNASQRIEAWMWSMIPWAGILLTKA